MKRALLFLAWAPALVFGQNTKTAAPTTSFDSLLANLPARNVGPTTMGGRVPDIAVYEKEPRIFFVGAASGGIWKTENGGITFNLIFSREGSSNIGSVAVSQSNPDLIWVGTGEATSRNSCGWGDGIYKTTDGGKTWKNMGLEKCTHFSHILIDPKNNDTVYAAGMGNLWGYNKDRGVYKTTDGGKTWQQCLYIDEKTGIGDMVMDPSNPKVILAAAYEKIRFAYNYISGGPGSALYKTTDGGKTWKKITKGMPPGNIGRIGLSFFRKDPKIVIATIENHEAGGTYRSTDRGESWTKISSLDPRPFYFSVPRQDPLDINRMYVPNVGLLYSEDMGKTFRTMPTSVHVDHHAFWIDPNDSNHMIIGEDGGVGQTRDRGKTWEHLDFMPIGQFYAVTFDMRKPYWVYGGLQDNGTWASPTQTTHGGVAAYDAYTYNGGDGFHVEVDPEDWTTAYSESQGGACVRTDLKYGGGRFIQPNARNTTPKPADGERFRFNWSTPFILSPHNSHTLYFGGNKLFKSVDRGDHWKTISPDLTTDDKSKETPGKGSVSPENTGAEMYCTIITIGESPLKQGLLWVGTDDGQVQISQDDGGSWKNVTSNIPDLPANTWCSRVTPSKYVEGRCYATFDGHRSNDYKTYVYVTEDFGKTWKSINANLPPNEPTYVIKEGLRNENLLYVGTEFSLWVSFDRGASWTRFRSDNFPTVPVHDIALHPRDGDLILATHGRSIYIIPAGALEDMTKENMDAPAFLCKPAPIYNFGRVDEPSWDGDRTYVSRNTQPGTYICYYLKADTSDVKLTISDAAGRQLGSPDVPGKAGLNVFYYTPRNRFGAAGRNSDLRVSLKVGGKEYLTSIQVEEVTDQINASPPHWGGPLQNQYDDDVKSKDDDDKVGGGK